MKQDWRVIFSGGLQFLCAGLFSVLACGLSAYDAVQPLGIESCVEILQESLLVLSTICFTVTAVRMPQYAGGIFLLAGLTFAFFVREMDACLDLVAHGFWKYVLVICFPIYLFFLRKFGWRTIIPGIAHYIRSRSFTMFLPGIVTILVYSRLFGCKYLWELYLPPHVGIKQVKCFRSLSEESMELLGYAIIFAASLIAAHAARRREQTES